MWIEVLGDTNQALRLLSVVLGTATLLAIFFLGRKMFDEKTGLIAAAVLAILPLHIQYSQEVRAYPLSLLLVVLASWAYWSACQVVGQHQEKRYWLLYLGLVTASLYTHYLTIWSFVAHGIFALSRPRAVRLLLLKRLLLVASGILFLLSLWVLGPHFGQPLHLNPLLSGFWVRETLVRIPALLFYFFAGFLPGVTFKSLFGFTLFAFYAMSLLTVIPVLRRQEERPALFFALLLLLGPILSVIGIAALFDKAGLITHPRFVFPAIVGLCLILGRAMMSSRQRALPILVAVTVVAFFLHFQVKWVQLNRNPFTPWYFYGNISLAVTEVNRTAKSDELLLFDDGVLLLLWNVYQKSPLPQLLMGREGFSFNQPMDFDLKWQEVENKYAGIYFVRLAESPPREVLQRLEARYQLINRERIGRLEIRHYVKLSPTRLH